MPRCDKATQLNLQQVQGGIATKGGGVAVHRRAAILQQTLPLPLNMQKQQHTGMLSVSTNPNSLSRQFCDLVPLPRKWCCTSPASLHFCTMASGMGPNCVALQAA